MISRRVKVQLVVFVLLSFFGIVYTGLRYVGFHVVSHPMKVTADFTDSGGIFKSAAVTVRGLTIGKVGDLHLTKNGVAVDLLIDNGHKIPADTRAVVANLSAVGEQYVDLQPQTDHGPYLHDGSSIPVDRTETPIDDETLLKNLDQLVNSVDQRSLAITIDELGRAFNDTGPSLGALIDKGNTLTDAAQRALPSTVQLINDGKTVLDTQRAVSGELKTFSRNLAQLSQTIVSSDPDIRRLFDNGVSSAAQLKDLVDANRSSLPVLLDNLTTLGRIQMARLPGLESVLVVYPANVANGFLGAAGGIAHFGLVSSNDPPACNTGYASTKHRGNNQDGKHPSDWGGQANLNTYCTAPPQGPAAVRGSRNAPRPPGDTTAQGPYQPGGGTTPTASTAQAPAAPPGSAAAARSGGAVPTPYDPLSGLLRAPDGRTYLLGDNGGQQQLLGDRSWEWLLLSPAVG